MRRTYISPEFKNNKIYGTYNMIEESNFFAGKMLELEDYVSIDTQELIYYQRLNGEQIDFVVESSLRPYVFSSPLSKEVNHTLIIDETQQIYQRNNNTRWILEVNMSDIFYNYIFATLKKHRTFEGLKSQMTAENDVNVAVRKYIENNVLNRYRFNSIQLFVEYQDLREQNILRFKNNWKPLLTSENLYTKIQTETAFDGSKIKVTFSQERSSEDYCMNYFFNLLYEKI